MREYGEVTYIGRRTSTGSVTVEKHVDDLQALALPMRPDLGSPSPESFGWGDHGDATAQLALSLCAGVLGDEHAPAVYHRFKLAVITRIPRPGFRIASRPRRSMRGQRN